MLFSVLFTVYVILTGHPQLEADYEARLRTQNAKIKFLDIAYTKSQVSLMQKSRSCATLATSLHNERKDKAALEQKVGRIQEGFVNLQKSTAVVADLF